MERDEKKKDEILARTSTAYQDQMVTRNLGTVMQSVEVNRCE